MNVDMYAHEHFSDYLYVSEEEAKAMSLVEFIAERHKWVEDEIEANWEDCNYESFDDYYSRFDGSWESFDSRLAAIWAKRFYAQSEVKIEENVIDAETTDLIFTFADGSQLVATQVENEDGELELADHEIEGQFDWASSTVEGSLFPKTPGFDYLCERFEFAEEAALKAWKEHISSQTFTA